MADLRKIEAWARKNIEKALSNVPYIPIDESCFNRHGEEISKFELALLQTRDDYRIVKQEYIHQTEITTMWSGIRTDPNQLDIFETIVFSTFFNLNLRRLKYETESQALTGHQLMLKEIKTFYSSDLVLSTEENEYYQRI